MTRQEAARIARAAKAAKAPQLYERFWSKVKIAGPDDCWLWTAAARNKHEGYGAFYLDGRNQPASRIAHILSNGPVPEGMEVCHRCDNPPCCNPAHLFIGTRKDNNDDKVRKGRTAAGETSGKNKVTAAQVLEIRAKRESMTVIELGNIYGLHHTTISDICTRKSWRNI